MYSTPPRSPAPVPSERLRKPQGDYGAEPLDQRDARRGHGVVDAVEAEPSQAFDDLEGQPESLNRQGGQGLRPAGTAAVF